MFNFSRDKKNQNNSNSESFADEVPDSSSITPNQNNQQMNAYSNINIHDSESKRYYMLFNLRQRPYKLQYYMYFNNNLNMEFDVQHYNRLSLNMGRPPASNFYPRYYDFRYENESQGENVRHYSSLLSNTGNMENEKVIKQREYKGVYSNQLDYINFKHQMGQEAKSAIS